jgi:hypothetical protein
MRASRNGRKAITKVDVLHTCGGFLQKEPMEKFSDAKR